jgi:hypothetical protein
MKWKSMVVGRWCLRVCGQAWPRPPELDGSQLSALWAVPFAGVLLSIALMPLLVPRVWHHHFGKIAAGWALAFLLPFALVFGPAAAGQAVVHTLVAEYIPFIALLCALFTAAGGIYVRGNLHGSPAEHGTIMAAARCWPASWAPRARRCC